MGSQRSAGKFFAISFLALAVLAIVVSGCGSSSSSSSSESSSSPASEEAPTAGSEESGSEGGSVDVGEGKTVEIEPGPAKIAILQSSTANQYNQAFKEGAEEEAKKLGAEATDFTAEFDPTTQANQIATAISSGKFNGFVVQPAETNSPCELLSEKAPEANILVSVTILPLCNRALKAGEETWAPGTLNYIGGQTSPATYKKWAENIVAENPGPQKVLVVSGLKVNVATQAFNMAIEEVAEANPEFELLPIVETDFTTPTSLTKTQDALQANPDATIVLSILSDVTKGALSAIKGAGLEGKLKVYDVGGSTESVEEIKSGELIGTTPYFPKEAAAKAVESIVNARETGEPGPRFIPYDGHAPLGDLEFITKANVGEFHPNY
jgi:ribose transport system substrate-binding protein